MDNNLPPLFAGATHRLNGIEPVKVVRWEKDGDHPKVRRYPIEGRAFKGLLELGPKDKHALRFGEFIVEDAQGRMYVVSSQALPEAYVPAEAPAALPEAGFMTLLPLLVTLVLAALIATTQPATLPVLLGLGVTHLMYYSSLLGQWNGLANGVFDLDTDTMKTSAHTNTYAPNQDTHAFFSDTTNEVSGTNYTAGGATLASATVTRSTGTVTFDANDVVWSQNAGGFTNARKFVVYRSTGTAATSRLYSVVTADADVGNVTGDLTIVWNALGIATWTTT
jgi:hypothetical protein